MQIKPLEELTPRQKEVALLMVRGLTNKQIGARMGIVENVVKNYTKPIFDTFGVFTRLELTVAFARYGYVLDEDQMN